MRLLHAGPDHVRPRLHRGRPRGIPGRDPLLDERQHLPVWGLSWHRRRSRQSSGGVLIMLPFSIEKAGTEQDAIKAALAGGRYIAGGTTLVDLMREEVERPERLIDINALPLGGIRVEGSDLIIGAL